MIGVFYFADGPTEVLIAASLVVVAALLFLRGFKSRLLCWMFMVMLAVLVMTVAVNAMFVARYESLLRLR